MDRSQILNDPEQALRIALESAQAGIWTAIPCTVVSVNLAQMTIVAQPAIQGVSTDESGNESFINLPVLGDVPLLFPSAGGFALTLPIAVGDEVLVVFSSRAIDTWWQSGGNNNQPIENRMHDLSDGFAIPAQMSNPKTASYGPNVSATNARLAKQDGTAYVEITPAGAVNIVAPGGFNVTAPTQVFTASTSFTVTSPVTTFSGTVTVAGLLTATGGMTGPSGTVSVTGSLTTTGTLTGAQVIEGSIRLGTHKHTGVTVGGGTSGGPTP